MRFGGRGGAAAAAASLLAHSLLLLGLAWAVRPIHLPSARPEALPREFVYLEFPPLPSVDPALHTSGSPLRATRSPESARKPHSLPQRTSETARKGISPILPDDPRPTSAGAGFSPPVEAAPSPPHAGGSPFWSGLRDARLYVEPRAEPRPVHERLQADAQAAIRADHDRTIEEKRQGLAARQITIVGRRITVLGDSTAFHRDGLRLDAVGQRIIMPGDGRVWEDAQMKRMEQDRARESVLRERVRATRERKDAERGAGRQP